MLSAQEIEESLALDRESRWLEVKGPGSRRDEHMVAKVAHAALGLGNLRDGGHLVIGINDTAIASLLPGLSDEELASWIAHDDLARKLANYADPPLQFNVASVELSSGAKVAVIEVFEFSDTPHFCARDYGEVLQKGRLYVRPRRVPETSIVSSATEMREVVELAIEKRLRAYVETAERANVALSTENLPSMSDAERYDAEAGEAWNE
jgi:predicted HTH transcriptional regulator